MRAYFSAIADYMDRWVIATPWGTVRIHRINRSDEDRALHDHPWGFCSLILWGSYVEVLPADHDAARLCDKPPVLVQGPLIQRRRGWLSIAFRRAIDAHRIIIDRPVWTFVITGRKCRQWGFHTERGWVYWREAEEHWAREGRHPFGITLDELNAKRGT